MVLRMLLVSLLLCGSVVGAEAKISGPTEAKIGDLVVINAKKSTGKAFKWVMPDRIQTLSCSELEFGFASGTPGLYKFTLIAADTDNEQQPIAIATHVVEITGTVQPGPDPDPKPDPKPGPDPEPAPGDFEQLRQLSKQLAQRQGDKATAVGLAGAIRVKSQEIETLCERNQCPTLDGAKRMMVVAIENHLLSRPNSGGWAPNWREPINLALKQANTNTVATYLAAMRAIALGLEES